MAAKNISAPIALYGGSFDPIHKGHVETILQVQRAFQLNKIHVIPCQLSPHKKSNNASTNHRLAMTQLVCNNFAGFYCDNREILRKDLSYTVLTLQEMRAEHPNSPLLFIMGMDSLLSFTRWHRWQEIISLCHLVVCKRPGYRVPANGTEDGELKTLLAKNLTSSKQDLTTQLAGKVYLLDNQQWDISATQLRDMLISNKSDNIDQWLTPDVYQYICKHKLYIN